jgi:hypothetical protein
VRILDITEEKVDYAQDIITATFSVSARVTEGEMVMYNNDLFVVLEVKGELPSEKCPAHRIITMQKVKIKKI